MSALKIKKYVSPPLESVCAKSTQRGFYNYSKYGNLLSHVQASLASWASSGFRDIAGGAKVLRHVSKFLDGGMLCRFGLRQYRLLDTSGVFEVYLTRYSFIVLRRGCLWYSAATMDFKWIYMLPDILSSSWYDDAVITELCDGAEMYDSETSRRMVLCACSLLYVGGSFGRFAHFELTYSRVDFYMWKFNHSLRDLREYSYYCDAKSHSLCEADLYTLCRMICDFIQSYDLSISCTIKRQPDGRWSILHRNNLLFLSGTDISLFRMGVDESVELLIVMDMSFWFTWISLLPYMFNLENH